MTAGSPHDPATALAERERSLLRERLVRHGAVLLRGFQVADVQDFGRFVSVFAQGNLVEYAERSSPRSSLGDAVYTSTDYPPDEEIFLHNEAAVLKCCS